MKIEIPPSILGESPAQVLAGQVNARLRDLGNWFSGQLPPGRFEFVILLWPVGHPESCNHISNCKTKNEMIDAMMSFNDRARKAESVVLPPHLL
jgi:hypothetical protein